MNPTQLAVISDIHGNTWALDAVLDDIKRRGIRQIVNLGDCAYGSLDPSGAIDRLRQGGILSTAGNQDRILWEPTDEVRSSPDWEFVTSRLGPERLQWLRRLPATLTLDDLLLCHGTPYADDVYLLEHVSERGVSLNNDERIRSLLGAMKQPVILCGHSHVPRTVWVSTGQLIVNPGSVGIPAYTDDLPYPHAMEAGSPHARYAVLVRRPEGWSVEHVLVPYPWQEAAAVAASHGRDDRAHWIGTGRAL